jgi:hypothetical protein
VPTIDDLHLDVRGIGRARPQDRRRHREVGFTEEEMGGDGQLLRSPSLEQQFGDVA